MTTPASPSLVANPDPTRWVTPGADRTVLVRPGKVELGQGVLTALAQIVADGMRVRLERVRMVAASTDISPDEGFTAGSLSIQHSGAALRAVAATWHACLLDEAEAAFGAEPSPVEDGVVTAPDGRTLSYWDLPADAVRTIDPVMIAEHALVGQSVGRLDIPGRVFGTRRYLQDLRLPGQLYGRVLRPPGRAARLLDVDAEPVRALPGVVDVVRDGDFVGVIAEREDVVLRALDKLAGLCSWQQNPSLPAQHDLATYLRAATAEETVVAEQGDPVPDDATITASFSRPYLAHASIGTSSAIASWQDGRLRVWSHSQGVYQLRAELARWFDVDQDAITVTHVESAGCYGHNGADDAAGDAALLAASVPGRPVQVVWSRQDELGWAPFSPAMAVTVRAAVDEQGRPSHWEHDIWSNGHSGRPSSPGNPPLLAARHQTGEQGIVSTDPPLARGGGSTRNAVPGYTIPNLRVVSHRLTEMPLRTSAMRSLGAHLNVYAIESVVDDLAEAAGADPVAYRLAMLDDPRGRAVIEAVAEAADWGSAVGQDSGRGVAYARYKNLGAYCAAVAEVEVTDRVAVTRLTVAVDVGLVVNPDGVRNQIEGGAAQALSWTTKEQVRFDEHDVTSRTWEDYPIATFADVPPMRTVIVNRPDLPSLGAGETSLGPTAAAIGNAVRDALGVAIRDLPLTAENLMRS